MTHESTAYARLCTELRSIASALHSPVFQVSHRALAAAIGCSASRIPAFMARLEYQGSITRDPFKNCYLIDVSPLIDQGVIDQGQETIDQGVGVAADMAITPDRSGVIDHPMPNRDRAQQHAANQGSTIARSHARHGEVPTTTSTLNAVVVVPGGDARGGKQPPAAQLMAELGANPKIIRDAYAARPDWTVEQVRDRWEYDQRRIAASDGKLNEGVFFTALRCGETAPARPDPKEPLNPADYAGRDGFRLGSDTTDLIAERCEGAETIGEHASRILPKGASTDVWVFVQQRLARGDSDAQALAALASRGRR